jgi:GPH family glycoside/pentoside/hexuronide:cation symporter
MFFQLYFLTDVAGLRPDYAGWAVEIGRIWDAINDPLFGLLSDRIRSRWGRRRVVLLFGSLFTIMHVSYNSLTPEIARDYDERSSLNGYRMVFSISGTLFSIILATVLGWYITNSRTLFMILGTGLGVIAMIPPLIVFKVTWEDPAQMQADHMPMRQAIKTTLSNVPFRMVMGLYLFSWTTASILSAALIYFANYYLRVPEQANYFVLTAQGCALAFIPLWVWVAHKLDKRRAFILSMAPPGWWCWQALPCCAPSKPGWLTCWQRSPAQASPPLTCCLGQ